MNKKVITKILVSICGIGMSAGIISGITYGIVGNKHFANNQTFNGPILFNGKKFNTKNDAFNYAKSLLRFENINENNSNMYAIDLNSTTHIFDSPIELNKFINSKIIEIPTVTNYLNHNLNPIDNSIISNDYYKYNIDLETLKPIKPEIYNVYEGINNTFISDFNKNNQTISLENAAKDSYLQMHSSYYFNGIYFKSLQDLEIYLKDIYINECSKPLDNHKYKKIISPISNKILSNPIDFSPDYATQKIDYLKSKNDISQFLLSNAIKYIRINKNNAEPIFIPYNNNQIPIEYLDLIPIESLPIFKLVSNGQRPLYIIDALAEEEYNFIGPRFIQTDALVTNITNPELWTISNDSPEEIFKSQVIDILGAFFDLFFLGNSTNYSNKNIGFININNQILSNDSLLFDFEQYDTSNHLINLETMMYKKLLQVPTINTNLYYDFINMVKGLYKMKNYSSFYSIPIMYAWLIEKIAKHNASYDVYMAVNEYFVAICDAIDNILGTLFGKSLLVDYQSLNSEKDETKYKYFSIKKLFGINEYGWDFNNLASLFSGTYLIQHYKSFIAACSIFTDGIAILGRSIPIKRDIANENIFPKLLSESPNGHDGETPTKIDSIFNDKSYFSNHRSIYDNLQSLYDFFNSSANLFEDELNTALDCLDNDNNSKTTIAKALQTIKKTEENDLSITFKNNLNDIVTKLDKLAPNKINIKISYENIILQQFKHKRNESYVVKHNNLSLINDLLNNKKDKNTNTFLDSYEDALKAKNKTKDEFVNEIRREFKDVKTSQMVKKSSVMVEVSQEKSSSYKDKLDIVNACFTSSLNLLNATEQIINTAANTFYPDEIRSQMIASSVLNMIGSICSITGQFTPPPANIILMGVSAVLSFITGIIGSPEQQIYEYVVNDTGTGNKYKYYWDGGLVMNRVFGLVKENIRTINDAKIASPIQITESRNKDILYFNGVEYAPENDSIARMDALKIMMNNNLSLNNFNYVYSLESNPLKINDTNSFEYIYQSLENEEDLNKTISLSKYIFDNGHKSLTTLEKPKYISDLNGELFFNGMHYASKQELLNNMQVDILNKIKPTYVAKIPDLDNNGYPLKIQQEFHLPYPYFNPTKKDNKIISSGNDIVPYNYVISNNNTNFSYTKNASNVIKQMTDIFRSSFNVHSKKVSKLALLNAKNFSDINTDIKDIILYAVEVIPGDIKIFINKSDAYKYILKIHKTSDNDLKYENDFKLKKINKKYMYMVINNQKYYFDNENNFNNWFISQIKEVK